MKAMEVKAPVGATSNGNGKVGNRVFVPIGSLRPDPDQPRKTFDQVKLQELADSIKEHGVVYDLIVRHRPGLNVIEPDMIEKNWSVQEEETGRVVATGSEKDVRALVKGKEEGWYQIADGERRWRAAQLAGLKEVPVAVRNIDEKAKLVLQVITNQQREALSALEEAAAYAKEIESGRHTVESLYKSLGVSRGTLFSRLVLNRLHPPVRAALEAGKISVSVAGLVAMVPEKKQQENLLEDLTDESHYQFPWSFRDVQEHIEEEYCKPLKSAPFDTSKEYSGEFKNPDKSVTMLHLRGSCEKCSLRSGNIEGSGTKNLNVCTQPLCFEAKANAAWKERSLKANAAGQRTIDAAQWNKVKGQYVALSQQEYIGGNYRSWQDAMGGQGKKLARVLVQTPAGTMEVVERADAKEAAKRNGVKVESNSGGGGYDYKAEEAKRKAKADVTVKAVAWARPLVLARLGSMTSREAWGLVAKWVWDSEQHSLSAELKAEHKKSLNEAELRRWVLEALYCNDDGVDYRGDLEESFVAVCDQVGVDVKKQLKAVQVQSKAEAKKTAGKKSANPPPKKS